MQYDAFISYSHAADGKLAPAIQKGLQGLAKPWNKRSALRVFRDETGLSVNPHLWHSIVRGLDESEWFIVLASPEAAQSEWVDREIAHFLASRPDAREHLLPVVTSGIWAWDDAAHGFSAATNCVPKALATVYSDEPRHLDMSWARDDDHLHLRRADFRSAIADIAAPIHGIPKDELEVVDLRVGSTTSLVPLPSDITSIAWSTHASRVLVGLSNGTIRLLDIDNGRTVEVYDGLADSPIDLAMSSDGTRLVAATRATANFWDLTSGTRLDTLELTDQTSEIVPSSHGSGYWRRGLGDWTFWPEYDPELACELAAPIGGAALEALLGRPSVCAALPELGS